MADAHGTPDFPPDELKSMRSYIHAPARRITKGNPESTDETVAVEVQVNLYVNGVPAGGESATPDDLSDFAYGYLFSKGILSRDTLVESIVEIHHQREVDVQVCVDETTLPCTMTDQGFEDATAGEIEPSTSDIVVEPQAIYRASCSLLPAQGLMLATGATHAAVFANPSGEYLYLREDVSRTSAVDKLIGCLVRRGVDPRDGFVFLSSRCAFVLVEKCARYGIGLVATVSAPTSIVLDFAARKNITLCAFARDDRFTVYSHPERIVASL